MADRNTSRASTPLIHSSNARAFLAAVCAAIYMGVTSVAVQAQNAESSRPTQPIELPSASGDIELRRALANGILQEQLLQARRDAEEELTKQRQRAEALVRDLETARSEQEQILGARRDAEEELTKERQRAQA